MTDNSPVLVQMRTDVSDTHIAVCSPQVLEEFAENFDYSHFRMQLVRVRLFPLTLS